MNTPPVLGPTASQRPAPLEMLMLRTSRDQVRDFMLGCSEIRSAVEEIDPTHLVLPMRGSLPIAWTMEGDPSYEPPSVVNRLELPIGTFSYSCGSDTKNTGLNKPQKAAVISECMDVRKSTLDGDSRVAVIDEVQGGGTVIPLMAGVLRACRQHTKNPVSLLAAQDSRLDKRPKTSRYKKMVAGEVSGLQTTVVPMPLICTDRDALLDTVKLSPHVLYSPGASYRPEDFITLRNEPSESLMRFLGSVARSPQIARDPTAIAKFLESQPDSSDQVRTNFAGWLMTIVHRQPD